MKYENLNRFIEWLNDNMKLSYNLDAVLEDVRVSAGETGTDCYELSACETKSGNPEHYSYKIEYAHDEEYDTWDNVFIF